MRVEFFGKTSTEISGIASLVLRHQAHLSPVYGSQLSGFNLPNKVANDPLLLDAARHLQSSIRDSDISSVDLCLHYSLKYNAAKKSPEALSKFKEFLSQTSLLAGNGPADGDSDEDRPPSALPVKKVLLVSGGPGGGGKQKKQFNTVTCLQSLREEGYEMPPGIDLGVAFNPYWPAPEHKHEEYERLKSKLATRYVKQIYINFGSDTKALEDALTVLSDELKGDERTKDIGLYGSLMVPSKALLAKFKFRMWSGLFLSEDFLGSVEGAAEITREIKRVYDKFGVECLVESAIRTDKDMTNLIQFIESTNSTRSADDKPMAVL